MPGGSVISHLWRTQKCRFTVSGYGAEESHLNENSHSALQQTLPAGHWPGVHHGCREEDALALCGDQGLGE